jgi:hypothetical protein
MEATTAYAQTVINSLLHGEDSGELQMANELTQIPQGPIIMGLK